MFGSDDTQLQMICAVAQEIGTRRTPETERYRK
jgi:hypothetical protein